MADKVHCKLAIAAMKNFRKPVIPNIFDYATTELSQDAFLCWLVACAKKDVRADLRQCGRDFVQFLMRSGGGSVIDPNGQRHEYSGACEVGEVPDEYPIKQHQKSIDVYFQAMIDDKTVSFLIEDKTLTQMHGDQLEKYLELVCEDETKEDLIKPIYFKTGYIFDHERKKAEEYNYSIVDSVNILKFFEDGAHTNCHEILRQWMEVRRNEIRCREGKLNNWPIYQTKPWPETAFDDDFVQWKFMVALGKSLSAGRQPPWQDNPPARYVNLGGGYWTQYPHYEDRGGPLFWRLDSWKHFRLMLHTDGIPNVLERWDDWSQTFDEILTKSDFEAGSFQRRRLANGQPVNEGTIGAIDIVDLCGKLQKDGLYKVVDRIADFHWTFFDSCVDLRLE